MDLVQLIQPLINYKKIGEANPDIQSVEMDSRLVTNGCLFICIEGYTVDGHDYAQQAIKKRCRCDFIGETNECICACNYCKGYKAYNGNLSELFLWASN
jgi:UDP-N-acetylmuramyl pentapeptide synthase